MQTSPRTQVGEGVFYFDDFLSQNECAQILQELDAAFWSPSLTYQKQPDGKYLNVRTLVRVSETAHQEWFSDELITVLQDIERRLEDLFHVDPEYLEFWQATDYRRNGKFDYHLDAGYWDDHWAGDRILTFLTYLTTPLKGGKTRFRALDLEVEAIAGRLLVWENLFPNGECNHRMVHSGTPVLKGRKATMVTWQRQKVYRIPK